MLDGLVVMLDANAGFEPRTANNDLPRLVFCGEVGKLGLVECLVLSCCCCGCR